MTRLDIALAALLLMPGIAQAAPATTRVIHADLLTGKAQFDLYVEPDTGGSFLVSSGGVPDTRFQEGDRVMARRAPTPKGARVAASPTWIITPLMDRTSSRQLAAAQSGVHRTVFIIVDYADKMSIASENTAEGAKRVADYYVQTSRGKVSMPIDILGPVKVTVRSDAGCPYSLASSQADTLLPAATGYMHKVYLLPYMPGCPWSGLGTVGGNPSRSWINGGGADNTRTIVHEMGHNFGLWHSHSRICPGGDISIGCSNSEYGDFYDIMGAGGPHWISGPFNASQQRILGWATARPVAMGLHTLTPYETTGDSIRIPRGNDVIGVTYYAQRGGPVLHLQSLAGSGNGIYLLIPSGKVVLTPGMAWTDTVSKLTIATESMTPAGAQIRVSQGDPPPPPTDGGETDLVKTFPATPGVHPLGVCSRQIGGTSVLRIGQHVASITNPRKSFEMRCQTIGGTTTLSINGVMKLTVSK